MFQTLSDMVNKLLLSGISGMGPDTNLASKWVTFSFSCSCALLDGLNTDGCFLILGHFNNKFKEFLR